MGSGVINGEGVLGISQLDIEKVALTDIIFGSFVKDLDPKAVLVDTDKFSLSDSENLDRAKKISWADLKTVISGIQSCKLIQTQELNSQQPSTTFTVPSGFRNLVIKASGRTTCSGNTGTLVIQFNGDTSASYDYQAIKITNSIVTGVIALGSTSTIIGDWQGASAPSDFMGSLELNINNYSRTNGFKTFTGNTSMLNSSAVLSVSTDGKGSWRNSSAITSITISLNASGEFVSGSTFSLYGLL
jgi:hypothetical protein